MKTELTEKFDQEFPEFFQDIYLEILDGWFDLLWDLCLKIREEINKSNLKDFKFTQIKEKFALLNVYCYGENEYIRKLISEVLLKSGKICENCGTKENVTKEGKWWIKTFCKDCRLKLAK